MVLRTQRPRGEGDGAGRCLREFRLVHNLSISDCSRIVVQGASTWTTHFIYWDNSNIFHEAQRFAELSNDGPDARYRVRINFDNMYRLAHAERPVKHAVAAGSVPPEMRQLWNRMENLGS